MPIEPGDVVTCTAAEIAEPGCEYFTRYGNDRVPGECHAIATFALINDIMPRILVCHEHAARIVERFPNLGGIARRFLPLGIHIQKIEVHGDDPDRIAFGLIEEFKRQADKPRPVALFRERDVDQEAVVETAIRAAAEDETV
jgi:hypothetical protein